MTETTNAPRTLAADWPFVAAAFLGSSLVFVVQPMIARQLLPTLGGAPAVWTTCVLFFQTCLLVGYAWAHLGPRWLGDRAHAVAHVALLVVACAFLPLGVARGWTPREDASPAFNVLAVLTRSVGVPLCVLCATSPLIQRWHVALDPNRGDRVYRLYAIGNVASLLVLLAYPIAIEPTSTLRQQLSGWSIGFVVLAVVLAGIAIAQLRAVAQTFPTMSDGTPPEGLRAAPEHKQEWLFHYRAAFAWVTLSAIPSSLLLGVTTFLTTDVAAVPFLWVLPLALYLGAFSLAFAGLAPWPFVRRAVAPALAVVCLLLVGGVRTTESDDPAVRFALSVPAVVALRAATFFLLVWAALASLYARRPEAARLTAFYLWVAVGGVVGGAFNSLLAPLAFHTTLEYPAVLAIAAIVSFAGATPWRGREPRAIVAGTSALTVLACAGVYSGSETRSVFVLTAGSLATLVAASLVLFGIVRRLANVASIAASVLSISLLVLAFGGQPASIARRSFFGVHRVGPAPGLPFLLLNHGTTLHGQQWYDARTGRTVRPDEPLMYYHRLGPLGSIMDATRPARVGVVGLGAGGIAAYMNAGQSLTYFEIDPVVIALADGGPFTFVAGARQRGATVEIVEGDARVTLGRTDRTFDLLVLDAFSGDAIPAHLLTREAFALYAKRLAPGGTLAVHISNRYLNLAGVVSASAAEVGANTRFSDILAGPADADRGIAASTWAVVARDPAIAKRLEAPDWQPLPPARPSDAWTDDYSNLFRAMK